MAKRPPPHGPLAVTVKTAAQMVEVSPRTVYRLLSEGVLKRVKLRGSTRVSVASIQALVAKGGTQ